MLNVSLEVLGRTPDVLMGQPRTAPRNPEPELIIDPRHIGVGTANSVGFRWLSSLLPDLCPLCVPQRREGVWVFFSESP